MRTKYCCLLAFGILLVTTGLEAQVVCPLPPAAGAADLGETAAVTVYNHAVIDGPTCVVAAGAGCAARVAELQSLLAHAKQVQGMELDCSVNGQQPAGTSLNPANQAYYSSRAALWGALVGDLTQHATDGTHQIPLSIQDGFLGIAVPPVAAVSSPIQCNASPLNTPYSDCDMTATIIGGVEQSAQSSLPSATTPFLRLFTRAGPDKLPRLRIWAYVRILGAPQASSTSGVVSVVTDPAGNITTQTFSGIGTSVDFMLGGEYVLTKPGATDYSVSFIAGYGGTTPLTANTLAQAFKAPPFGTVECSTLQSRFQQQFAADKIAGGTSTNAVSPSCLVNTNSIVSGSGVAPVTFTPITTIGFTNQDRTSFLGKALFGIRTIDRFTENGNLYCGDTDPAKQIGPCERGIVDFLVGQDATVTGGQMRHFVFKIDAVHPLPVKSVSFLYLFGSATLRLQHNTNYPPLILQAGDVTALSGNGSGAVPNPAVVVLPLTQPERDFYRFGAGINISNIFKKLFSSPAPATP